MRFELFFATKCKIDGTSGFLDALMFAWQKRLEALAVVYGLLPFHSRFRFCFEVNISYIIARIDFILSRKRLLHR